MEGLSRPKKEFVPAEKLEHWYNICALEVMADGKGASRCSVTR